MPKSIFFEIPIYRINKETHTNEMDMLLNSEFEKFNGNKESDLFKSFKFHIENMHWKSWHYNEIIGFLNLYIFGNQFRIDYWQIDNNKINRNLKNKKYKCFGKIMEVTIDRNLNSDEIYELMLNHLTELNKTEFKKFYLDLKTFKNIGKFVQWKDLTTNLNSFK